MKKIFALILVTAFTANSYSQDKKKEDIKSIKSMCGCYEVKFNFAETFQYSKDTVNYKPSKTKHDYGLEWVELVENQPNKIVMQHLLIVDDKTIIKHWRQDWLYENTDFYQFFKDRTWNFKKLSSKQVKGQWTQKVYQVDDSPRYEGTATWVHLDGRHTWENTTDAPLPRREHTVREDYNVLKRTNVHEITSTGWIHDQDNDKIVRSEKGDDIVLAQEKGHDVYTKVDDSKCKAAQNWWTVNNTLWKSVRDKWETVYKTDTNLSLQKTVDNQPLFMKLFSLKPDATKEEISRIIDSYIVK
ncbi:DUF6607 family protein [Flavobacterium sp.]|uniref:DUF6607 family protein n=1 Tax=Flavobacterium sp. TaxID=239 RepID=UPI002608B795|nr:DUF6607 family protein [Flavobacterium sp.]